MVTKPPTSAVPTVIILRENTSTLSLQAVEWLLKGLLAEQWVYILQRPLLHESGKAVQNKGLSVSCCDYYMSGSVGISRGRVGTRKLSKLGDPLVRGKEKRTQGESQHGNLP